MIRFTVFGVPVEIQPWFWITAALLGGATHVQTRDQLLGVLVFMVVATLSILVHEFGHALTGRKLGGGAAHIVLWALGGLAYNQGGRFTRWQRFWMIFMGPGAGFLLLALVVAVLCASVGLRDGLSLASGAAFHTKLTPGAYDFYLHSATRWEVIYAFVWINFWWGAINLLPILPLDGGQIADLWVRPQRRMFLLSAITGTAMAMFGLSRGSLYIAILFGFLAYRSFKDYQSGGWR